MSTEIVIGPLNVTLAPAKDSVISVAVSRSTAYFFVT